MNLNISDKQEIKNIVQSEINVALGYVDDNQHEQEKWGKIYALKFNSRLKVVENDIHTLKADVGVLKSDVGVLKSDVGVLKKDVSVLRKDVDVLKTDMVIVKHQLKWQMGLSIALLAAFIAAVPSIMIFVLNTQ